MKDRDSITMNSIFNSKTVPKSKNALRLETQNAFHLHFLIFFFCQNQKLPLISFSYLFSGFDFFGSNQSWRVRGRPSRNVMMLCMEIISAGWYFFRICFGFVQCIWLAQITYPTRQDVSLVSFVLFHCSYHTPTIWLSIRKFYK